MLETNKLLFTKANNEVQGACFSKDLLVVESLTERSEVVRECSDPFVADCTLKNILLEGRQLHFHKF